MDALVLGWSASAKRTIASLRRSYMWAAGHVIARSSFYGRLSEPLLSLLKKYTEGLMARVAQRASSYHGHTLEHFEDKLAVDTTIIRLDDMLSDSFPGCSNGVASAKLDIGMNIAEATPRRLKIAEGKQSDQGFWTEFGGWVSGKLMVFDLSYYDFNFFHRLHCNSPPRRPPPRL